MLEVEDEEKIKGGMKSEIRDGGRRGGMWYEFEPVQAVGLEKESAGRGQITDK